MSRTLRPEAWQVQSPAPLGYVSGVEIRVLGPLEVLKDGEALPLGGPQQRLVLAALLAAEGQAVSTSNLIDSLWPDDPPASARKTLQGYVHRLRSHFGGSLTTTGQGYRLDTSDIGVDSTRFQELHLEGKALLDVDPRRASELITEGLDLWNGSAYSDLATEPALLPLITRLEEERLDAVADRIEADLRRGAHHELTGELGALVHEFPLRERFWSQLMIALYRSGRQGEALRTYERLRRYLADEMGIEPSAEVTELEERILLGDEGLAEVGEASPEGAKAIRGYELRQEVRSVDGRTVFRGYQRSVGRQVAVTVIGKELANNPGFIARFQSDTEKVAQLDHPNIVYVQDTWREPDRAFQVSRWIEGRPLEEVLSDGRLSTPAAMRILEQVGDALSHAHRLGVSHGQLSAGSILVTEDQTAFLTDFAVGTAGVDAPPAEDLAGFAVVAHRALVGEHPVEVEGGYLPTDEVARLPSGVGSALSVALSAQGDLRLEDFLRALRRATATAGAEFAGREAIRTDLRNPFKGLQAFQQADSEDFFGREELSQHLVQMVERKRLVAVVGPSGAGKSSVVRAGLIPHLRGARHRFVVEMFPGAFPFEELAGALVHVAVRDINIHEELVGDERGLSRVLKHIMPDDDSEILLVIDQFEELFSMVSDEPTRALFLASLASAVDDMRSRLRVILTLRADFFDRPLEYPEFGSLLEDGLVTITSPDSEELARAVSQPAAGVGLRFEAGLVPQIVGDVGSQPGGLPLLQYALTELFRRRSSDVLTFDDYNETGGVYGALGRRAEELYAELPKGGRKAMQQAFLRLVTVEEGADDVRRRVSRSELNTLEVDRKSLEDGLRVFGAARLLTFDYDPVTRAPTVEVAHEALIREWDRLANWVDRQREDLVHRKRLDAALSEWVQSGEDDGYLLTGGRLSHFIEWSSDTELSLSDAERSFLEESQTREEKRRSRSARTRRNVIAGLSVAAVVSSVLAVASFALFNRAEDQRIEAESEREAADTAAEAAENARADAEEARAEADMERANAVEKAAVAQANAVVLNAEALTAEAPDLAAALAIEAMERLRATGESLGGEAVGVLVEARRNTVDVGFQEVGAFEEARWLGNGTLVAVTAEAGAANLADSIDEGSIAIYDVSSGRPSLVQEINTGLYVTGMAGIDGTRSVVATHNRWPYLEVRDINTAEQIREVPLPGSGGVTSPIEYPDVGLLSVIRGVGNYKTYVLDTLTWGVVDQHETYCSFGLDGDYYCLGELSEDGSRFVTFSPDGQDVVVSEIASGNDWSIPLGGWDTTAVEFSPDGTLLVVAQATRSVTDGQLKAYSTDAGGLVWDTPIDGPLGLAWTAGGEALIVAGRSGVVSLIDSESGVLLERLPRTLAGVTQLDALAGTNRLIASFHGDRLGYVGEPTPPGFAILDLDRSAARNAGDYQLSGAGIGVTYLSDDVLLVRLDDGRLERLDRESGSLVLSDEALPINPGVGVSITAVGSMASIPGESSWTLLDTSTLSVVDVNDEPERIYALSPDGEKAITYHEERSSSAGVELVELETGETLLEIGEKWEQNSSLLDAAFSSDGILVATVHDDGNVALTDTAKGIVVRDYLRNRSTGYTVEFTDDDQHLIVGASDGVRVYDVTEVRKGQFVPIETRPSSRAFAAPIPHGSRVLVTLRGSDNGVVWDWRSDEDIFEFPIPPSPVSTESDVSPSGDRLAIVRGDVVQEYYLDIELMLSELAGRTRPLTEVECQQFFNDSDCRSTRSDR